MKNLISPLVAALAVMGATSASAADADIEALRAELAQVKQAYEQRLSTLEARLAQYETRQQGNERKVATAEQSARKALVAASQKPASEAAFNPSIYGVLVGTYTYLERNPGRYQLQGFMPTGSDVGPARRNFGLGESEVGLAANIDPYFRGQLTLSIPPDSGGVGVEEAFIQTLSLGHGLTLKGGRFLSGIGYLNGQHAHAWDFADAPLVYKAMLGGQLHSDGVQIKWVAPLDWLLELGGEAASGGPFPSTDRNENGATLFTAFAHAGGDVGASASWRGGVSFVNTSPRDRQYADVDATGREVTNAFSGRSRMLVLDGVWKWAPNGNANERNLTLQGEYFLRDERGNLRFDVLGAGLSGRYTGRQQGLYAEAVYQFMPRWRVGYRYDWLDAGTRAIGLVDDGSLSARDFPVLAGFNPERHSVMLDWSLSEFSRIRLQYAHEDARAQAADNQLWVQFIASLGAHRAHSY